MVCAFFVMNYLIAALATWRLTTLFVNEDGPFDLLVKFRSFIGIKWNAQSEPYGTNFLAEAFTCVWCLSIWIGALMAIFIAPSITWYPVYVLALSAAAIMIEETINGKS